MILTLQKWQYYHDSKLSQPQISVWSQLQKDFLAESTLTIPTQKWGSLLKCPLSWVPHVYLLELGRIGVKTKYRRIRVLIRHSPSRRISRVCALNQVEAQFWNPKIVFTPSANTSPVRKWLNTKLTINVSVTYQEYIL